MDFFPLLDMNLLYGKMILSSCMFCCFSEENTVEIVENGGGVSTRHKNPGPGAYTTVSLEGRGCDKYGFVGWI